MSTSRPTDSFFISQRALLVPALIASAVSLAVLFVLFAVNPYASGYGAHLIPVLKFANTLWRESNGDWQHCYLVPFAVPRRDNHGESGGSDFEIIAGNWERDPVGK